MERRVRLSKRLKHLERTGAGTLVTVFSLSLAGSSMREPSEQTTANRSRCIVHPSPDGRVANKFELRFSEFRTGLRKHDV